MIPVLFEKNEEGFTTNGICHLADSTYCRTHEGLNDIYELIMEYPATAQNVDEIKEGRIVLAKANDSAGEQPFRIYKVTENHKRKQIYARHKTYDLAGVPVSAFSATGVIPALSGLVNKSMVNHPFTVWSDIGNVSSVYTQDVPRSFRSCLGGVQGSILDTFGGEFEWDVNTVKLHAHRGEDRGVEIRYGKNLTSFENERSNESAYDACVGYWSSEDTTLIGDVQFIEDTSDFVYDKVFILDCSQDFQEAPTTDQLNEKAVAYMNANNFGIPFSDTIKVSHVNLSETLEYQNVASLERIGIGDTVHVIYKQYDVSMRMIEYTYDVILERYVSTTLGRKKSSLGDKVSQIASTTQSQTLDQAVSMMDVAISHAQDVISGGTGGYVVIGRNADGQPNEIYIMDSPDMDTAVNVLRMNYAGIAFSQTGVNGTFVTAWDITSNFVADFITAGSINGNLITAGSVLTSALEVAVQTVVEGIKLNFSFLNDGLHIAEKDASGNIISAYNSLFTELGMRVINTNTNVATLIAEQDTVTAENLTANQYFRLSVPNAGSRFQEYHSTVHNDDEVGCFWEAV